MLGARFGAVVPSLILAMTTAVWPARAESRNDVEYCRVGETSLRMDVHTPGGAGPFPAVVIVHGGGWVTGDRRNNVAPLFKPLEDAGFAWFSISYRLAGSMFMFGDAVKDVIEAVKHVRAHAADYRIDPARVALVGESAGAQLASMAALSPELKGVVKGVVALYSPSDLVGLARTSKQVPEEMRRSLAGTPFGEMLLAGLKRLSPIENLSRDMPPFLLIHGTDDRLVPFDQSERMCAAVRKAGGSCELYTVRGGGHGMRWWESVPGLTTYKAEMVRWLKNRLLYKTLTARSETDAR